MYRLIAACAGCERIGPAALLGRWALGSAVPLFLAQEALAIFIFYSWLLALRSGVALFETVGAHRISGRSAGLRRVALPSRRSAHASLGHHCVDLRLARRLREVFDLLTRLIVIVVVEAGHERGQFGATMMSSMKMRGEADLARCPLLELVDRVEAAGLPEYLLLDIRRQQPGQSVDPLLL